MATCTVTFQTNKPAVINYVKFQALAGQVVGGLAIPTVPVVASIGAPTANDFQAILEQGGQYKVIAPYHFGDQPVIAIPASATANLRDLLNNVRSV